MDNKVADFLSCIHYDEENSPSSNEGNYALDDEDSKVIFCSISRILISDFIEATSTDADLLDAIRFHSNGWPAKASIPFMLRPFFYLSLSVEGGYY